MTKNSMTFAQKGQIFELFDNGKDIEEIAELTNYSVFRVTHLIDGLKGDSSWEDAKQTWKDNTNERTSTVRSSVRQVKSVSGRETLRANAGVMGSRKTSYKRGSYDNFRADPNKNYLAESLGKGISEYKNRPYKPSVQSGRSISSGDSGRTTKSNSVVNTFRNAKDYKGEL